MCLKERRDCFDLDLELMIFSLFLYVAIPHSWILAILDPIWKLRNSVRQIGQSVK
jgi:hypothetical protein